MVALATGDREAAGLQGPGPDGRRDADRHPTAAGVPGPLPAPRGQEALRVSVCGSGGLLTFGFHSSAKLTR